MTFERVAALYLVASLNHSGQSSRGYRLLSRLVSKYRFEPGFALGRPGWGRDWPEAVDAVRRYWPLRRFM